MQLTQKAKNVIAAILTHPIIGNFVAWIMCDKIPAFGLRVDTHSPAVSPHIKAKLFWGIYESAERRFVSQYLPLNANVVELGASLGVLTCLLRRVLPKSHKIVAVEANPNLIPIINSTLKLNNCEQGVIIEFAAISYKHDSEVLFHLPTHSTDGRIASDLSGEANRVIVPVRKLFEIIQDHNFDRYSLVIDIEGAEWEMFEQDMPVLEAAEIIIIELHSPDCKQKVGNMQNRLLADGRFELVDHYGAVCVLRPIKYGNAERNCDERN